MHSKLTELLHPSIDKEDKYDPTFLGVTRKRRVHGPESEFLKEDRGKRISVVHKEHVPVLGQLESQYREETFAGDTKSTRFGQGFQRKPAALIGQDSFRVYDDERKKEQFDKQLQFKREHFHDRTRATPYHTITGGPPITGPFRPPPFLAGQTIRTFPDKRYKSNVFPNLSGSPAPSTNASSQLQAPEGPQLTRRQQLLRSEGLMATKKEWSVAQQMACQDGYVLPKIASSVPAKTNVAPESFFV